MASPDRSSGPSESNRPESDRPESDRIEIVLVDDHPTTRTGIQRAVEKQMGASVVAEADDWSTGFDLIKEHVPDVAVVDLSLPDGHGFDLLRSLRSRCPDVRLVVFSMFDEEVYAKRALQAGAQGYVMKVSSAGNLLEAIRRVAAGNVYLSPKMRGQVLIGLQEEATSEMLFPIGELTDRELQVFQLLGESHTADQIADHLNLARKTVETHRRRAKEKLGCESVAELVASAVQWKLTQVPSGDNPPDDKHLDEDRSDDLGASSAS